MTGQRSDVRDPPISGQHHVSITLEDGPGARPHSELRQPRCRTRIPRGCEDKKEKAPARAREHYPFLFGKTPRPAV